MTSVNVTASQSTINLRPATNRCGVRVAYIEACALQLGDSPQCTRGGFVTLPLEADAVPDPLPPWRPPHYVELSPGDRIKLSFAVTNDSTLMYGFSSDRFSAFQSSLQSVLELPYGRRVFRSSFAPVVTNNTMLHIPPREWKNGIPRSFNNAVFTLSTHSRIRVVESVTLVISNHDTEQRS